MTKIIDIEQGSKEWLELRTKYYKTASRTPIVMGLSPFTTKEQLAREILYGEVKKPSPAMLKGIRLEKEVLKKAGILFFKNDDFEPKVGLKDGYLASLDGLSVTEKTILEVKVSPKTYNNLMVNLEAPECYYAQIQHQLMVFSDIKRANLVAFNELEDNLIMSKLIEPDLEFHKKITQAWDEFDEYLKEFEDKNIIIDDSDSVNLAKELEKELDYLKELEQSIKVKKEKLSKLIDNRDKVFVGNFTISRNKGAKRYDYLKFLNEKNIDVSDLDSYATTSKDSIVFRLSKK